ncbi:MAG TPA: 50S ribosomal protein L2 [Phycisphaerae bacterium]|nr:50S ribosomal protein L2 [Phycisphaerae bacterium]
MGVIIYKPRSAGRRNSSVQDFSSLTKKRPEKQLTGRITRKGGRNNQGVTTARFRGGGHRRLYRAVDFRRDKDGVAGKVTALEYDPNRSAWLALISYVDGEKRYILAPEGLKIGDTVQSGEEVEPRTGNCMPLANIPAGIMVHNIELVPQTGGKLVRSAGRGATLSAKEGSWAYITLPSGETRRINLQCRATIGTVGNADHSAVRWGKAGRTRHKGRRSHSRGSAMNPVDHPMGGGEGRRSGGRDPMSPTGVLAKGGKTRRRRNPTNAHIIRRRIGRRYGEAKIPK